MEVGKCFLAFRVNLERDWLSTLKNVDTPLKPLGKEQLKSGQVVYPAREPSLKSAPNPTPIWAATS